MNLTGMSRGKRQAEIHPEPLSATYEGQAEYLEQIAAKYQDLIDIENAIQQKA